MAKIILVTYFIEVSKSYWYLTVVPQNVLDGSLGTVHDPVGDPLSQARLGFGLLLDSEEEDDRLDGDTLNITNGPPVDDKLGQTVDLEEDSPVDHG